MASIKVIYAGVSMIDCVYCRTVLVVVNRDAGGWGMLDTNICLVWR